MSRFHGCPGFMPFSCPVFMSRFHVPVSCPGFMRGFMRFQVSRFHHGFIRCPGFIPTLGQSMFDSTFTHHIYAAPRLWWVLVAGIWFAVLSFAALWLIPIPGASAKFTTDPLLALSVTIAAFLSGALCWWLGFHRDSRILGTGASVGLGTALLCLLANPVAWLFSLATIFLWPVLSVMLLSLGGVVLELGFKLFTKVWPNE